MCANLSEMRVGNGNAIEYIYIIHGIATWTWIRVKLAGKEHKRFAKIAIQLVNTP